MGMAASQARFLQLTARKNNDEYMGQQINQSRTALANKSAGLFEKMLALQPPTPPSSMDDKYYTQGYGFSDPRDGVRKKITWDDPATLTDSKSVSLPSNPTYINASGDSTSGAVNFETSTNLYDITANELEHLPISAITGLQTPAPEGTTDTLVKYATFSHTAYNSEGQYTIYTENKPVVCFFDSEQRLLNFQELSFIPSYVNDPTNANYYDPGSVATATTPAVLAGHNVPNPAFDNTQPVSATNPQYVLVRDGSPPTISNMDLDFNTGEVKVAAESPITIAYNNAVEGNGVSNKDLTYNGNFDEVAFQQDMDRYEFEKNAYDYQIERINLETKQIQEQDKSLELKLKQIDTDHQAIQTEMEAVSKVITKNIESTFKTFA